MRNITLFSDPLYNQYSLSPFVRIIKFYNEPIYLQSKEYKIFAPALYFLI